MCMRSGRVLRFEKHVIVVFQNVKERQGGCLPPSIRDNSNYRRSICEGIFLFDSKVGKISYTF